MTRPLQCLGLLHKPSTGARCVDRFAVHFHPRGDPIKDSDFLTIESPVWSAWNIQHKRAILADRIDQPMDSVPWLQISTKLSGLFEQAALVMPGTDTGLRLPCVGHNAFCDSALVVSNHGFGVDVWNRLDIQDGVHLSAVCLQIMVVEVGADVHSGPAQRQEWIVEIQNVGIMLIDQITSSIINQYWDT